MKKQVIKVPSVKRRIFVFLFNQKPITYGLTYLFLIPCLALFYSLLPRSSFYHSTSQFEKTLHENKAENILKDLKEQIIRNHIRNFGDIENKVNSGQRKILEQFDPRTIRTSSFRYEKDMFYLTICWPGFMNISQVTGPTSIFNEPYFSSSNVPGCYEISFSAKYGMMTYWDFSKSKELLKKNLGRAKSDVVFLKDVKIENNSKNQDSIFYSKNIRNIFYSPDYKKPMLSIDEKLHDKLIEYSMTSRGFPISFWENYWRMFYFSTVTITTLGYGDIVPLTAFARMLIAVEAILGVVLIGLFLNALSKRTNFG